MKPERKDSPLIKGIKRGANPIEMSMMFNEELNWAILNETKLRARFKSPWYRFDRKILLLIALFCVWFAKFWQRKMLGVAIGDA